MSGCVSSPGCINTIPGSYQQRLIRRQEWGAWGGQLWIELIKHQIVGLQNFVCPWNTLKANNLQPMSQAGHSDLFTCSSAGDSEASEKTCWVTMVLLFYVMLRAMWLTGPTSSGIGSSSPTTRWWNRWMDVDETLEVWAEIHGATEPLGDVMMWHHSSTTYQQLNPLLGFVTVCIYSVYNYFRSTCCLLVSEVNTAAAWLLPRLKTRLPDRNINTGRDPNLRPTSVLFARWGKDHRKSQSVQFKYI